jgi:hypothetical protein
MKKLLFITLILPAFCSAQLNIEQRQVKGLADSLNARKYTLQSDSLTQWALKFNETKNHNVYCGYFFPVGIDSIDNFFYEAIVRPDTSAAYVWSAGFGGAHYILFGFSGGTGTTTSLTGNVYNPSIGSVSFGSTVNIAMNTDHHIAVGYSRASGEIIIYLDGVPVGRTAYSGWIYSPNAGDEGMYIGGSTHSNYNGLIYRVRAFLSQTPVLSSKCFYPDKTFKGSGENFSLDFTTPSNIIPDLSDGFYTKHPGVRNFFQDQVAQFGNYGMANKPDSLLPQWVHAKITKAAYSGPSVNIPGSALVCDSFHRGDIVPFFQQRDSIPSLDSTEGGTLGKLPYIFPFGIVPTVFSGIQDHRAYFSNTSSTAYVDVSTSTQDIRVSIDPNYPSNAIIVRGRFTDANNYVEVYNDANSNIMYLFKYVAGVGTQVGNYSYTPPFTEVKLVLSGTTGTVYIDGVSRITGSVSGSGSGTKAGFGANSALVRYTKFQIF